MRTQHAARQALVLATEERKSVAAALRPDSPGPLQTALSSERGLVATFYATSKTHGHPEFGLELDAGASGSDAACADAASRRSGFRSPSPSPRVPRARSPGAGAGARLRSRSRQKLAEALEWCDTLKAACRSFGPLQALPLASVASAPQASPAASAPHQPQAAPSVAQIVRGGGRLRSRSRRRIAMADALMGAIRGGAAEVTSSGCAATGNSVADASSSGGFGSGGAAVLAAQGPAHVLFVSGKVTWCRCCGAYADSMMRTLLRSCPGPPTGCGGRGAQLRRFLDSAHPRTGAALPLARPLR